MSDKTEYSRLLLKRTGTPGVVPTIPTGNTLSTFIDTDTFIGEIFVNVDDDNAWIRTNNGQIPILVSGSTAASLASTLLVGNQTGAIDIEIDSNQVIRNMGVCILRIWLAMCSPARMGNADSASKVFTLLSQL